jgi:hypothetical protein
MAKYDKLIITGEVQERLDAQAMSRVILLLARQILQARTADKQTIPRTEASPESEQSS